mgnify:CR=1 FL=1
MKKQRSFRQRSGALPPKLLYERERIPVGVRQTHLNKGGRSIGSKGQNKIQDRISRMEKKYEWKDHLIFMGLLFGLAVWVNRGIEIKGLYMDDLYFWSCYGEQSFLQYVFPMGSTRFRFLYYLAAWLEMAVVGIMCHGSYPLTSF